MMTITRDLLDTTITPLATRMRPQMLSDFIGQEHLLGVGKPLHQAVHRKKLHSMILWGPPGIGKTTLAQLITQSLDVEFETISAVLAGVKEIREIVAKAKTARLAGRATVLFVDEVHRFNKSQQDAFLPHVESGEIILIGATTENPSFQLNNALLSRIRVYVLKPLTTEHLVQILQRALRDKMNGLGEKELQIDISYLNQIAKASDGDARQALNLLEMASDFAEGTHVPDETFTSILKTNVNRFDHQGDIFYDQISALHKSVRGSDPDAALYWLACMITNGCDPVYLARRIVRMANEDIGNADPRALTLALEAWQTYERLGSPEGELALAQAVVYCACAAKSNALYVAWNAAQRDAKTHGSLEVPLHLRNAPTHLMKSLGHGAGYRYAHDEPDAFAKGVCYFPEFLCGTQYYFPVERGLEIKIKEKLDHWRALNVKSQQRT